MKPHLLPDQLLALVDLDALREVWEAAAATKGEHPCKGLRHGIRGKCGEPGPHESCQGCFSWRDCVDPACNHPACGRGPSMRFRDALQDMYPALVGTDVFMGRSEPVPLIESGRLRELIEEGGRDAKEVVGRKVLDVLRRDGGLHSLYEAKIGYDHVEAEMWLVAQDVAIEASMARYQSPVWFLEATVRGQEVRGGMSMVELRLGHALTLDEAPVLTQGALF